MTTIIAVLIVIGIVVFVHELGHFLAARWAGARVDVFSIGFGRPIIKWNDSKDTEWRISWIPLGGFVSVYGHGDMFDRKKFDELPANKKLGHYLSLAAWKRALIIGAGAFMNLVLAWVIYSGLFMAPRTVQMPIVGEVENSELVAGDRIMQVGEKRVQTWGDMLVAKELNVNKEVSLLVLRGENLTRVTMPAGVWGIAPDMERTEVVRYGFFGAIERGAVELWTQSRLMVTILAQIITGERPARQLGGLLRIAEFSGQALSAGIIAFLSLIALISVNLGIINLMPLPALDGGYLVMLAIEGVTGKKLEGKAMTWVMYIGWGLLISLIALTFWNDIVRLIS